MKDHWHEQIQRYVSGQASAAETAALQAALHENAELRALYLDYMNLDVALSAAAEVATIAENGMGEIVVLPRSRAPSSRHYWPWLAAAAAACAALVMIGVLSSHRDSSPPRPDVTAVCSSTQEAIARFSVEPPSVFPAWASPTASMLDQPQIPQWDR
jgi:anti-sigma factor RsiW